MNPFDPYRTTVITVSSTPAAHMAIQRRRQTPLPIKSKIVLNSFSTTHTPTLAINTSGKLAHKFFLQCLNHNSQRTTPTKDQAKRKPSRDILPNNHEIKSGKEVMSPG
jgi:hypothetical protein